MKNYATVNTMVNSPMMEYYLFEAQKGNADAAYEAAKITALDNNNDVYFIQKRFFRAADLGDERAQRILGILGLCQKLMTEDSTYGNIHFNPDRRVGFEWLTEAACTGDVLATYLIGCCHLYGIGTEKSPEQAQRFFMQVISKVSMDVVLETMMLFESISAGIEVQDDGEDIASLGKKILDGITAIAS